MLFIAYLAKVLMKCVMIKGFNHIDDYLIIMLKIFVTSNLALGIF